jgi:asparagine synthetase B (glutamine-hydrolysing)
MCGIAVCVGLNPAEQIGPMLESIEHRGRDDQGQWLSDPIDDSGEQVCLAIDVFRSSTPAPAVTSQCSLTTTASS